MSNYRQVERDTDQRFQFGKNWQSFLKVLNDDRIRSAEGSLKKNLEADNLKGVRFLDIGSGSGLFSLAARRLGAEVFSLDYDAASVACTAELKRRYFPEDPRWTIDHGSVLDANYIRQLGEFDVVYSWGVLHHTGEMWRAMENAQLPVSSGGKLYIAIYNNQSPWTAVWTRVKRIYNLLPRPMRLPFVLVVIAPIELRSLLYALVRFDLPRYVRSWTEYDRNSRGMSRWHDIIDWVGGYPFETAKPEQVFDFYRARGFVLNRLSTCGCGLGCNEYVFQRERKPSL